MGKVFENNSAWIGTMREWNDMVIGLEMFEYDFYIVISENGDRLLMKCRY